MSIAAMARSYIQEMLAVDPVGPYLLIGRCQGGIIALEMAHQLQRAGRRVGLLALIDTRDPVLLEQRTAWRQRLSDAVRDAARIVRWRFMLTIGAARSRRFLPAYRRFVAQMVTKASGVYRPDLYVGRLTLFLSSDQPTDRADSMRSTARYATDARTIVLPGDHDGFLSPPWVGEVARQLQACIDAADQGGSNGPSAPIRKT
jgi:thioesterase domain-containing protein